MVNDSCPVAFGTAIGAARAETQIDRISAEAKPKTIAILVNMGSPFCLALRQTTAMSRLSPHRGLAFSF
jgi:hypothetical protein